MNQGWAKNYERVRATVDHTKPVVSDLQVWAELSFYQYKMPISSTFNIHKN
jgi:hypothetical protein